MNSIPLKVSRIGNSRGVRLPADTLRRYGIESEVVMEERSEGILLRPIHLIDEKLSWEESAREMANEAESWGTLDSLVGDGLEALPWDGGEATETAAEYGASRSRKKK